MAGFKINVKGAPVKHSYEYRCNGCEETMVIKHLMEDIGKPQLCSCCGRPMQRVITAPALDADWHDSQKSHNLNWDL